MRRTIAIVVALAGSLSRFAAHAQARFVVDIR